MREKLTKDVRNKDLLGSKNSTMKLSTVVHIIESMLKSGYMTWRYFSQSWNQVWRILPKRDSPSILFKGSSWIPPEHQNGNTGRKKKRE